MGTYRDVLSLRPTQFAIGMREVQEKITEMRRLGRKALKKCVDRHEIPIVIGPRREIFLVDHHHFARACWELGIEKVRTHVLADFSSLKPQLFWKRLRANKWLHTHDQFGKGPHDPDYLPFDVRGLGADPYRSLAWAAREEGAFAKTEEPFAEFFWAEYFRERILVRKVDNGFKKATAAAVKLAKSPAARRLPGYIGTLKKGKSK